ncbi:MAG TPA: hypothetical protein VMB50_12365, partial [Myxococcales bacterium]|nr:hypothetical protein [Myxococcales bacterium]
VRSGWPLIALASAAGCLFPSPDAQHRYACASDADCPKGEACNAGHCGPPVPLGGEDGGLDGGVCMATCADGGVRLCDGGFLACGGGQVCDLGSCVPGCPQGQGCPAGSVCDLGALGCVAAPSCPATPCGSGDACVAEVCVASPSQASAADSSCGPPPADGGSFVVQGFLYEFPGRVGAPSLASSGGWVTFFLDGGVVDAGPLQLQGNLAHYSLTVPHGGIATALVQGLNEVPTYFPNLTLAAGAGSSLDLPAVVPKALVTQLGGGGGASMIWVGNVADCDGGLVAGYTVGLSPAPAALGYFYYDSEGGAGTALFSTALQASTGDYGAFLGYGAPLAPTSYAIAVGSPAEALLSGTFDPPADRPAGLIAVALVQPSFPTPQ